MKHTGLYFGSFNPIHIGHLIIAQHFLNTVDLHQVWFVVTPHNPFKPSQTLLNEYHRLHLVRLGIGENPRLKASEYPLYIYERPGYPLDQPRPGEKHTTFLKAPLLDISASHIRRLLKEKKPITYLVPKEVEQECTLNNYYRD